MTPSILFLYASIIPSVASSVLFSKAAYPQQFYIQVLYW